MGMRWGESHNTLTNMKKILQILVLIAASVIPGTGMAATNYGIRFDGTMINSDNCQNLTSKHLVQGSVKYDYSSNTLTLDNVYFDVDDLHLMNGKGSYFQTIDGSITIGKGTQISFNVGMITTNHDFYDLEHHQPGKDIIIGENCWIAMNSMILPGVVLGP